MNVLSVDYAVHVKVLFQGTTTMYRFVYVTNIYIHVKVLFDNRGAQYTFTNPFYYNDWRL